MNVGHVVGLFHVDTHMIAWMDSDVPHRREGLLIHSDRPLGSVRLT